MWTTVFIPGGARGVAQKSNSPKMCAYAERLGFVRGALKRFKDKIACGSSLFHSVSGKLGSHDAKPALK